jgi:hypothetical protein
MPNALYKIIEVKSFDHGMVVVVRTGTDKEPYFFSYYLINGDDEEKFGLKKGSLSSHGFSRTFNLVSGSIEPTNVSIKHFAEKNGLLKVSPSDQTKPDGNTEPNVKPPVASATPPPPVEEVEIGKLITIDKKSDSDKIKEFSQWGNKFFGSFSGTILIASNEKANFKHDNVQFDELHSKRYTEGCKMTYYENIAGNKSFLTKLLVLSNNLNIPFDVKIGCSPDAIIDVFGKPGEITPKEINYRCGSNHSDLVTFHFEKSVLAYVQWDYDVN